MWPYVDIRIDSDQTDNELKIGGVRERFI